MKTLIRELSSPVEESRAVITSRKLSPAAKIYCRKCRGLLVAEHLLDFYQSLPARKCINCGWSYRPGVEQEAGLMKKSVYP